MVGMKEEVQVGSSIRSPTSKDISEVPWGKISFRQEERSGKEVESKSQGPKVSAEPNSGEIGLMDV